MILNGYSYLFSYSYLATVILQMYHMSVYKLSVITRDSER